MPKAYVLNIPIALHHLYTIHLSHILSHILSLILVVATVCGIMPFVFYPFYFSIIIEGSDLTKNMPSHTKHCILKVTKLEDHILQTSYPFNQIWF